ncbi:MAG: archease [Candidatus Omnitrophota bacterium]
MKKYEQIPHTADLAVRVYGKTLEELFENAAYAMFDLISEIKKVKKNEIVEIQVKALDQETLLIAWLNELLYICFSKKSLFCNFSIRCLTDIELNAGIIGQDIGKDTGLILKEIKAATYHDVNIKKTKTGYQVDIVFDV